MWQHFMRSRLGPAFYGVLKNRAASDIKYRALFSAENIVKSLIESVADAWMVGPRTDEAVDQKTIWLPQVFLGKMLRDNQIVVDQFIGNRLQSE